MKVRTYRQTGFLEWSLFAGFGLALVLLASQRLVAEFHRLGAAPVVHAITENRGRFTGIAIADAAAKLIRASFFTPQNRMLFNNHATVELARYELFLSEGDAERAFATLSRARHSLQKALKVAPGDANIWYLLAETHARLSGSDKKTFDYLRFSYLTGPREGWIARRRLGLSLRLWPLLPEDIRKMARREMRSLWSERAYRRDLVRNYLRATVAGREAVLVEISRKGENEKTRFLNLANYLKARR